MSRRVTWAALAKAASVAALSAEMPAIDGIVGRDVVHDWRARPVGAGDIGDRRQHPIVDDDLFGRVPRRAQRFGDDDCNMVAGISAPCLGERRMSARAHRRTVLRMDHPAADQPADFVGGEIVAGEDCQHAGIFAAAPVAIFSIAAWACGERTKAA